MFGSAAPYIMSVSMMLFAGASALALIAFVPMGAIIDRETAQNGGVDDVRDPLPMEDRGFEAAADRRISTVWA